MITNGFSLAGLTIPDEKEISQMISRRMTFRPWMEERILGEIFFKERFIFTLVPKPGILQVTIIGGKDREEVLLKFCKDIEDGIKAAIGDKEVRKVKFSRLDVEKTSSFEKKRFSRLLFEEKIEDLRDLRMTAPNYTTEDIEAARLLVDPNLRSFCLKLAQVGKIRDKDAAELAGEDIISQLLSLGLLTEEYLLTCKQDQHTICIISSKDDLSKEPTASLRCSVCGRKFSDEMLNTIYTLTEKGKRLITGSTWMSIWVTELLIKNGIKKESIRWGIKFNGEELDIMVEDFGSRVFFELKDREFGLGDAYPFIYRVSRYGGRIGVVVTMDKVSSDAKKFFKEEARRRDRLIEIRYLEGIGNIKNGIAELVKDLSISQVQSLILPFSFALGIDLWPIVYGWIKKREV